MILADYHVDFLGYVAQVKRLLTCGIAAAYYGNALAAVEESIACGTCRYSEAHIFLFVRQTEITGGSSGAYYHGFSCNGASIVGLGNEGTSRQVDVGDYA